MYVVASTDDCETCSPVETTVTVVATDERLIVASTWLRCEALSLTVLVTVWKPDRVNVTV